MFCHQKNGFHENHLGISSSMSCPNLEGKHVNRIMHQIKFNGASIFLLIYYQYKKERIMAT